MNDYLRKISMICWLLGGALACSPDLGSKRSGGHGRVQVAISGEDIAREGIAFPEGSEVTIVDGWEIELSHVLVTIGNVTLSENPDLVPSDQSRTGSVVATAAGPWAVDLHAPGSIPAAGGEGLATPLTSIENQTERDGRPFAADERYAFGYDIVAASADAQLVNFADDAEAMSAYADMIDSGATVLYVGNATFRGRDCQTSDEAYDFAKIPEKVQFRLAFQTPTSFINCQNQDNQCAAYDDQ